VILDLRGLTFMDATGLKAVLGAVRDASERGRLFATVGVTDSIRKLFEITGTVELLHEAEALGLIQRFMRPDGEGAAQ
jgi:anti-anti-sigma factor